MTKTNDESGKKLIMEYFKEHPKKDIKMQEIRDWFTEEYNKRTGKVFREPTTVIRKLSQEGLLIKVDRAVFKYDPDLVVNRNLEYFSVAQKDEIMKRDEYKCVVCGMGIKEEVELQVDHIIPKDKGGKATIDNGQTLCVRHNNLKKTYSQTDFGKRLFIDLYQRAKKNNDKGTIDFSSQVLEIYEKNKVDGHRVWKR